ncbi:hypothetical protein [Brevundimonas sp.]|uniref:hypothetical protein n=1 Tax=Brevundimonas sp. TaxID=1871086 RepID=UPI002D7404B1|nr:hypothetical protein [Brevundimonas sp.]HYC67248.1 hypothetical protein [Brevundimonas sp.]
MTRRKVDGELVRLKCRACGGEVSHLVPGGDSDMATNGLGTAASCSTDRVALGEMTTEEWAAGEAGLASFEGRIQSALGLHDLKVVPFLRAEKQTAAKAGEPFPLFRSRYRPPVLIYRCPCCGVGEAEVVATMSIAEFRARGGEILIDGNVEI